MEIVGAEHRDADDKRIRFDFIFHFAGKLENFRNSSE